MSKAFIDPVLLPPQGRPRVAGNQTDQLFSTRTEENLSHIDKTRRDLFIREYIKDFNGGNAILRMGFQGQNPKQMASKWLREPYVQQRLMETVRTLQPTDIVTRGQVIAKLWQEANDPTNEGGVRVAATAHIGKMLGMCIQEEKQQNAPVGVMFVPVMALGDWSTNAAAAQKQLKNQVVEIAAQVQRVEEPAMVPAV